jgi:bifunctional non-homologous end joining protein LigD
VKPKLVAEVKFKEWTRAGIVRAPVFLGLRPDIKPQDCKLHTNIAF